MNRKKAIKTIGIVIGSLALLTLGGLAYIGLGEIFHEKYHDPEHWAWAVYQSTRYGWSLKLDDGWAA